MALPVSPSSPSRIDTELHSFRSASTRRFHLSLLPLPKRYLPGSQLTCAASPRVWSTRLLGSYTHITIETHIHNGRNKRHGLRHAAWRLGQYLCGPGSPRWRAGACLSQWEGRAIFAWRDEVRCAWAVSGVLSIASFSILVCWMSLLISVLSLCARPANPLRVLGEFLLQKSNEVEGETKKESE